MDRYYLTDLERRAVNVELLLLADIIGVDEEGREYWTAPAIKLAKIIHKHVHQDDKEST